MPRDVNGNYTLVAGNPVLAGTLIESAWANSTLSDIADGVTNSLSRNGNGGMLAPLRADDGTVSLPGYSFTNSPNSGLYLAGTNDIRLSIANQDVMRWDTSGVSTWNGSTWINSTNTIYNGTSKVEIATPDGAIIDTVAGTRKLAVTNQGIITGTGSTSTPAALGTAGIKIDTNGWQLALQNPTISTTAAFSGQPTTLNAFFTGSLRGLQMQMYGHLGDADVFSCYTLADTVNTDLGSSIFQAPYVFTAAYVDGSVQAYPGDAVLFRWQNNTTNIMQLRPDGLYLAGQLSCARPATTAVGAGGVDLTVPNTSGNRGGFSVYNSAGGSTAGIAAEVTVAGAYPTAKGRLDIWVQEGAATRIAARFFDTGAIATGGLTAIPNGLDPGAIAINTDTNDASFFMLLNNDIAHGITNFLPSNCALSIAKAEAASGGATFISATENKYSAVHRAICTVEPNGTDYGIFSVDARLKNGSGTIPVTASGNLFAVLNSNTQEFVVKGNGDAIFAGDVVANGVLLTGAAAPEDIIYFGDDYFINWNNEASQYTTAIAANSTVTINGDIVINANSGMAASALSKAYFSFQTSQNYVTADWSLPFKFKAAISVTDLNAEAECYVGTGFKSTFGAALASDRFLGFRFASNGANIEIFGYRAVGASVNSFSLVTLAPGSYNLLFEADGAGNCDLYVNGTFYLTMTGCPTSGSFAATYMNANVYAVAGVTATRTLTVGAWTILRRR